LGEGTRISYIHIRAAFAFESKYLTAGFGGRQRAGRDFVTEA
jgi:hypothetical protein